MGTFNIIIGGKLGDFITALYGVCGLSNKLNKKANIYLIDIGWDFGIENTYKQLYPILMQQNYINDFQILTEYKIDPIQTMLQNSPPIVKNKKLLDEGYIVNDYINSPLLYKKCWSRIYSNLYDFQIIENLQWLNYQRVDPQYLDYVIIHRKNVNNRFSYDFPYEQIINTYNKVIFVSTNEDDYNSFSYKHLIDFKKVNNLDEIFLIINSCAMYVGNLTGPVVIARALNKPCIVELHQGDANHWIGEEEINKNVNWYLSSTKHTLKNEK